MAIPTLSTCLLINYKKRQINKVKKTPQFLAGFSLWIKQANHELLLHLSCRWDLSYQRHRIKSFQQNVAFRLETNHLISIANRMTGLFMKCNTSLKWVKQSEELIKLLKIRACLDIINSTIIESKFKVNT